MRPLQLKYWYFIYVNAHILLTSFLDFYWIWAAKLAPGSSYCNYHTQRSLRKWKKKKENSKDSTQLRAIEFSRETCTTWTYWSCTWLKLTLLKEWETLPAKEQCMSTSPGQAESPAQPLWDSQVSRWLWLCWCTTDITACPSLPSCGGGFWSDVQYLQLKKDRLGKVWLGNDDNQLVLFQIPATFSFCFTSF